MSPITMTSQNIGTTLCIQFLARENNALPLGKQIYNYSLKLRRNFTYDGIQNNPTTQFQSPPTISRNFVE